MCWLSAVHRSEPVILLSKLNKSFWDSLIPYMLFYGITISNIRGDRSDILAITKTLLRTCWEAAGKQKLLSEQYLMDCSWEFGNNGCNGGFQDKAFNFVVANGGIASNEDYPYYGVNRPCRSNATAKSAVLKGFVNVEPYQREQLQEALLTKGPMTVSLDAESPGFAFYKSGAFILILGTPWHGSRLVCFASFLSRTHTTHWKPSTCASLVRV